MTEFWPDAPEPVAAQGITGIIRHRPHRIIRHRMDEPARRIATAVCVGALATSLVTTTATSVVLRDTSAPAASAVGDPAPVGVDPNRAQNAVSSTHGHDPAPGEGTGTPEPLEPPEHDGRRAQVAADNDRADRNEPREPVSATSTAPAATVQATPEPSPGPGISPSSSPSATTSPTTTPDPSPSASDSGSPAPTATQTVGPTPTGSTDVGRTTRNYGTCVPRMDRKSWRTNRTTDRASGNDLCTSGVT